MIGFEIGPIGREIFAIFTQISLCLYEKSMILKVLQDQEISWG